MLVKEELATSKGNCILPCLNTQPVGRSSARSCRFILRLVA